MPSPSEPTATSEGLRLIGAGFGRTGTASLKTALEALGYGPCYHMLEVITHPAYAGVWNDIVHGAPADWPAVFAGYRATVDWPGCSFYQELMQVYPEAKVLLSVRDPDLWYESARATIYRTREFARAIAARDPSQPPRASDEVRAVMITELIWKRTFDDRFEDRDYAIAVYRRHNDEVQQRVPADKLLVYDVSQGWEPLCAFLGVAVPEHQPFPHANDRAEFLARVPFLSPTQSPEPASGTDES